MPVGRNVAGRTSDADFGREYDLAFGTAAATSDSKKRKLEPAKRTRTFVLMSKRTRAERFGKITATCVYTGSDDEFVRYLEDLQLNPRSLALLTLQVFPHTATVQRAHGVEVPREDSNLLERSQRIQG